MDNLKTGFKAGEVIVGWTKPFVKVLTARETDKRCANCFSPSQGSAAGLSRCAACKISCYCSKKCQRADWKFAHSVECKLLLFHKPILSLRLLPMIHPNFSFIVARILAHLKLHPEREHEQQRLWDGCSKRSFSGLMAHVDDDDTIMDELAKQMSTLTLFADPRWSTEYVRKILGIWKTNAFELLDEEEEEQIGGAIYIQTSVFDHSCRPNAVRVMNREQCMEVRCIGDIPEGQQPHITYLAGVKGRDERQAVLKLRYSFDCVCDLCEEEKDGAATNYELLQNYEAHVATNLANSRNPFKTLLEAREQGIQLYSHLFVPHDERVTNFSVQIFNTLAENSTALRLSDREKESAVKKLADDTLKRLEITFGKEYYEYKDTKARMIRLNIKVDDRD